MLKRGLKIALVQLAVGPDKKKNTANAILEIRKAKARGAQLVVLPECFNSPAGSKYAEEVPTGETCQTLSKAAIEFGVCVIAGAITERYCDKKYNTCTVWDTDGKLLAKHRKIHLYDVNVPGQVTFRESSIRSAGDKITTFDFQDFKIGLGICYDLRFQEIAQLMADQGCSLLVYPGAFGMKMGPLHWELLGRARAVDQQLWVALVSPARDTNADYVAWGHTTLINPWGTVIGKLDEKPGTLIHDIDDLFIELIKSKLGVYDLQSPHYGDNNYEKKIWDEIEQIVEVTEVKTRRETLRAQYRKYLTKLGIKSGQVAKKTTKWRYCDQKQFLNDHLTVDRPRISSVADEKTDKESNGSVNNG